MTQPIRVEYVQTLLEESLSEWLRRSPVGLSPNNVSMIEREHESAYIYSSLHRYTYTLNFIPKSFEKLKVLDVGIGYGHLAGLIRRIFNYSVTGIDIEVPDHLKIRFDKQGIDFKCCDLMVESIPFKGNSFDLVLFCEVLEHLHIHPSAVLKEVNRVLKKGGILILTTPNFLKLYNRIMILCGKNPCMLPPTPSARAHFREYTISECVGLLKRSGFDIEKVEFYNTWSALSQSIRSNQKLRLLFYLYQIPCKIIPSFKDLIIIKSKKVG